MNDNRKQTAEGPRRRGTPKTCESQAASVAIATLLEIGFSS